MSHAAAPDHSGHASESTGTGHERHGVWVKRRSLSVGAQPIAMVTTERHPVAPDLAETVRERDGEASAPAIRPDPSHAALAATALPTGVERELRTLRAAIAELRRELKALRTGHEEPRRR